MGTFKGSIIIFFLSWNFLAINVAQGYYINKQASPSAESNAPSSYTNNNQPTPQAISLSDLLGLLQAQNNSENQETEAPEAKPQNQTQPESNAPDFGTNNNQASPQALSISDLLESLQAQNNSENQETEASKAKPQSQTQPESSVPDSSTNNNQASPQALSISDLLELLQAQNNSGNQETEAPEAKPQYQPQPEGNAPISDTNNKVSPQASEDNSSPIEITISFLPLGAKSSEEKPNPQTIPSGSQQNDNNTALEVYPQPIQQAITASSPQTEDNNIQHQQQNVKPTPTHQNQVETNESNSDQQQYEEMASNDTPHIAACCKAAANQKESPSKFQLSQVTASQILYHLHIQYEKLYSQQGDSYEVLQMFLAKMLRVSEKVTVEDNKNIASTTYAAYYSTEYAYTFALCKLHNITGGPKNSENKIDPKISSQCSQVVEKFTTFSVLYEKVISQTIASTGGQVLQYDNDNGTLSGQNSSVNPSDQKVTTSIDETIQRSNLEKDLHGYNDENYYDRLRSEDNQVDQYDEKQNQQIGNSTYVAETKGQKKDFSALMYSELRGLGAKVNDTMTDSTNGQKILRKSSTQRQTTDQAVTQGHLENDDRQTDTTQSVKYDRSEKQLAEEAQNYTDDDEADIGGSIKNAKIQEVDTYQTLTVEHIQNEKEQTTKNKKPADDNEKYTFAEAVQKLLLYIKTVHVFTSTMETNVKDKNNTSDGQGKDVYTEMHSSLYEQTVIYRRYLRKYFTNVNVENGTFNGTSELDTEEVEMQTLQTSIQRFLWLKNTQPERQTDSEQKSDVCSNPLKLLWYFEEASFYFGYLKKTETNVPFMGYLPYPDFNVKTDQNNENGTDVTFYLN